MTYWDAKKLYFVEMRAKDITAQQRANLRLLETMLDQAFQAGFDEGRKIPAANTKQGVDRKGFLM